MASTVDSAFKEFLTDSVRLDTNQTKKARVSRDNLISNIDAFSGDDDFFNLDSENHLKYGSFARRTKVRPLDDIDLMICISAEGRKYSNHGSTYYMTATEKDQYNSLVSDRYLNSTKVINRFIKKLANLNDYSKATMHKNQEAATLKLKSYDWNFDVVPCFHTNKDQYLIPDGSGNWKLTNPQIDNERISEINQKHKGNILDVIRIMKYWNKRPVTITINSYLLECMILDVYENKLTSDNYWIDIEFKNLLNSLSGKIMNSVYDPKGIQGNLNNLSFEERIRISIALSDAYKKACDARQYEEAKDQKNAIKKWGEVLGHEFPSYS